MQRQKNMSKSFAVAFALILALGSVMLMAMLVKAPAAMNWQEGAHARYQQTQARQPFKPSVICLA